MGDVKKLHEETFVKNHVEYGACFPENPENGEFIYVIGVEVKDGHTIPEGYHVCTIPDALYAVFSLRLLKKQSFHLRFKVHGNISILNGFLIRDTNFMVVK